MTNPILSWTEVQSRIVYKPSKKSRSLRLSVHSVEKIVVSYPPRTAQQLIHQFVEQHREWIIAHLSQLNERRSHLGVQQNQVLLFGEVTNIVVHFTHSQPVGLALADHTLNINPVADTLASVTAALNRYLRQQISQYITERCYFFSQQMNISYNKITFRNQSSRWGSCSSQGNLNFNEKLVHAPKEVVDYVVVHELAHRRHMNHSPQFWLLVEQFSPNYRLHRGWLKRHGTHSSWIQLSH